MSGTNPAWPPSVALWPTVWAAIAFTLALSAAAIADRTDRTSAAARKTPANRFADAE